MGYRHPTRQPGHELAESERAIDDHLAAASERRAARLRRLRWVNRGFVVGRWLIATGALAVGVLGVFLDSPEARIRAACLFTVVLLWWTLRLFSRLAR